MLITSNKKNQFANLFLFSVDGGWGYWGEYGPCDTTCGNGEKIKIRNCTNPAPANGGLECKIMLGKGKEGRALVEEKANTCTDNSGCAGKSFILKVSKKFKRT